MCLKSFSLYERLSAEVSSITSLMLEPHHYCNILLKNVTRSCRDTMEDLHHFYKYRRNERRMKKSKLHSYTFRNLSSLEQIKCLYLHKNNPRNQKCHVTRFMLLFFHPFHTSSITLIRK